VFSSIIFISKCKKKKNPTGESNSGWNKDKYGCSFPAMISEWRRVWSENSPTDSSFPFGFVQLAAWRANYAGSEFPVIRWHQTADVGYVPNDAMPVGL
jgi:sialate O-acetylesterase